MKVRLQCLRGCAIATQILELFSLRWPPEVCFRDVQQFLDFEDPRNLAAKAITRTPPLIFITWTVDADSILKKISRLLCANF